MTQKTRRISAEDLEIDLASNRESELFKWFLACLLFGKPIQQEVAQRTYFEFVKAGLTNPDAILDAGWKRLVQVLDAGHYVRYDESTATKLLEVTQELKDKYGGKMRRLLEQSNGERNLTERLEEIKHIGPTTARIFLRDLREHKAVTG